MLSDDGAAVAKLIINEISNGYRVLPNEISLKYLESKLGIRCQNIGMAFDPYVTKPLAGAGITARKCGIPVRIILAKSK